MAYEFNHYYELQNVQMRTPCQNYTLTVGSPTP